MGLERLIQDIRYALRAMGRSKGLTAVAIFSLALGIGANTAIFSLVDAVLLRTLPVQNPEELEHVSRVDPSGRAKGIFGAIFSYPDFRDLRDRNQVFTGVFARNTVPASVVATGRSERAVAELVSGNFFTLLGVLPALGRTFTAEDDRVPLGHPVTVLSYNFWTRRLGRDPGIIGKTIRIDSHPFTVIGVTPRGFFGVEVGSAPDLWVPMMMQPLVFAGRPGFEERNWGWMTVMARRKPGLTEAQAEAGLDVTFQQMLAEQSGPRLEAKGALVRIRLRPAARGASRLRSTFEDPLSILMVVVALVLLIACANIANLLLARGTARRREIAVRLALGASRIRLVRQLLTESVLLGVLGGLLGLLFAFWGANGLLAFLPQSRLPMSLEVRPDLRLLAFAFAVSVITGILFGLAPALQATRTGLAPALKSDTSLQPGARRWEPRKLLVIAQVALSLVLLIGAGLFLRSLANVLAIHLGIRTENVLLASLNPGLNGYKPEQSRSFFEQLLERVKALSGVRSASYSESVLLSGNYSQVGMTVPGRPPQKDRSILLNTVDRDFFETAGIDLLLGRDFGPQDNTTSPKVAIINETAARPFFGGENPVGRRVRLSGQDVEIIGVVRAAKYRSVREESPRTAYFSFRQEQRPGGERTLYIRTIGNPTMLAAAVRREVRELDRDLPIFNVKTLADQRNESVAQERLVATLSTFFGALALLLACIGLYGVMAYTVVRRTREIGIRMSLGAARRDVLRMVMKETLVLVVIGVALAISAALAAGRLIAGQLFGLTPRDPGTIVTASLVMLGVALLAGFLPARRASRIDPMEALRYE